MTHYTRKMLKTWLIGVFAFSLGQVLGFLNIGAPAYATKYFGDYAPWYLAIHIGGFAFVFALLFFGVRWLSDRKDRKCVNSQS